MNLEELIARTIRDFDWCGYGLHEFHDLEDSSPEFAPDDGGQEWPEALATEIARKMFMAQLGDRREIPKNDLIVTSEYVGADATGDGGDWTVSITHQPTGNVGKGIGKNNVRATANAMTQLREKVFGQ